MPVYLLHCKSCDHKYETLYYKGLKLPDKWACSRCESKDVVQVSERPHPIEEEKEHGGGSCKCCF